MPQGASSAARSGREPAAAHELPLNMAAAMPFRLGRLGSGHRHRPTMAIDPQKDFKPMNLRNLLIAAMSVAVVGGAAGATFADTPWQQHHPRREEVNGRLAHLNRSIREERKEGDISGMKAERMHRRLHVIRMQERHFARHDRGHITKREQARLNHEESGVRRHLPG
jgi:hypothetical protein